jgi:hypothetical protein
MSIRSRDINSYGYFAMLKAQSTTALSKNLDFPAEQAYKRFAERLLSSIKRYRWIQPQSLIKLQKERPHASQRKVLGVCLFKLPSANWRTK